MHLTVIVGICLFIVDESVGISRNSLRFVALDKIRSHCYFPSHEWRVECSWISREFSKAPPMRQSNHSHTCCPGGEGIDSAQQCISSYRKEASIRLILCGHSIEPSGHSLLLPRHDWVGVPWWEPSWFFVTSSSLVPYRQPGAAQLGSQIVRSPQLKTQGL